MATASTHLKQKRKRMIIIIIIIYIEVEKWKGDSCFNFGNEYFDNGSIQRPNSIRANPRSTTVFRSFISPSDIDFDPEQNGRRSARISLACGILIGSARLAVRRRSFSRQKTIFPSTRESPGASIDSRTRGKRTYDRVRGCASGSSKKRQAGIAYEQVKTNDLDETHERGETVVAFRGGGGETVFADEESFHGRRGTMGNLKTRVEHKSSFPFPLLSELCPPDFLPVALPGIFPGE